MSDLLGKVVICNESFGVIKFVGPLEDSEIWYGIEWKDYTRGKHDGSYKGKRYFHTKHPMGGSFVRPSKVDFGVDIWRAAYDKYFGQDEAQLNNENKDDNLILYNNFNLKSKDIFIKCVGLAYSRISSLDGLNELDAHFSFMTELDLEGNLLNEWSQMFTVLDKLKKLRIINVSNNTLALPSPTDQRSYENIQSLIMNRMSYEWEDVEKVLKHFPKLTELKVCFNLIHKIDKVDANMVSNLETLDLESNPIKEWTYLKKFGELNELKVLYANEVGISEIKFDECDPASKTNFFPKLKILSLNDNRISDWKPINELNKLKSMEDLRFKFNPLNSTDKVENIRELIIGRVAGLKILNRTKLARLNDNERKGAEIDYLLKHGAEWLNLTKGVDSTGKKLSPEELQAKRDEFNLEHPRFPELIKLYGAAEECEVNIKPQTLKSSLVSLNLKNEESGEMLLKKLPLTTEIQRLKAIISKFFKSSNFDLEATRLFYITSNTPNQEYELDNEFRTLGFYAIENGDTIIVRRVKN